VLQDACRQASAWQAEGFTPIRMSVNVSVRQMREPGFAEQVATVLAATGLEPDTLEIEITESTLQSVPQSQEVVARLHELGVAVALDDFGTGYSSLSLLRHLSIDRIKIDRSFVCDLPDDPACAQLTRTLVQLGHGLGLQITAEGIETAAQARFLAELGAVDGQGYLYARPLAPEAVSMLLQRR
jgi:EAL domain-containing protein (putative c-di-GMP-specific phosphodiesterase class I)